MFEIFSIVPSSLIMYWIFFAFLCISPMIFALITDKKHNEKVKELNKRGEKK